MGSNGERVLNSLEIGNYCLLTTINTGAELASGHKCRKKSCTSETAPEIDSKKLQFMKNKCVCAFLQEAYSSKSGLRSSVLRVASSWR